jgi:DNA transposition AAA+ family ATPase
MHSASHPEHGKQDKEPQKANPVLREQLESYRGRPNHSNNTLARKLGCSSTYVQLYIQDQFPGDLFLFERKLVDFFNSDARRRASGVETAECEDTKQIRVAFELIRKTNDLGVIVAASGEGKSRGIEAYVANAPTVILFRATVWASDKQSVESTMFETIGRAGYDGRTKRAVFMVDKLRGSDRFIIVDDAHKLTRPAVQWFFDFHDATLCPVALVGTFDLFDKLEDDTQRFSRTGYYEEIKRVDSKGKLIVDRGLVKHLVKQLVPDANGETESLVDLAEQVAENHGHYRSVHKQLKLAVEIKAGSPKLGWTQAFHAAHTKLIRKYKLN